MLKVTPLDVQGDLPTIILNKENLYQGDLVHYFRAFWFTARSHGNPAHNFRHGTHVWWLCYDACKFYAGDLKPRNMRNLLIGSLGHDADHCGKKVDDSINIGNAIAWVREHVLEEDVQQFDNISWIMRGTQFEYVIEANALPLEGLILRDADLMQAYSPAWLQQVVFGFAHEWGAEPIDVLRMQKEFLSNYPFNTEWARQRVPPAQIAAKFAEIDDLIEILDSPRRTTYREAMRAAGLA